jgi:CHAT domain-containing protein
MLPAVSAADEIDLGTCAQRVQSDPDDLESYRCYWVVARRGDPDGARRALEALLAIDLHDHRARLYLAAIEGDLGNERAESLYREAAAGFAEEGERTGEVYARLSLFQLLSLGGRWSEADAELAKAAATAEAGEDPVLTVRVWSLQANRAIALRRYSEAYGLLRQAEDVAFPDGPADIRTGILASLGHVYWMLGLPDRALEVYTRRADLLAERGDPYAEAGARVNIAMASEALLESGRITEDEAVANVEEAIALAREAGNRFAEAQALLLFAQMTWQREESHRALQSTRSLAASLGHRRMRRDAERFLGYHLWSFHPDRRQEAMALVDGAIADARAEGDPDGHARGWIGKAGLLQVAAGREEWIEAYDRAIEAVERVRDLQPDGSVGARHFASWSLAYQRYSGCLLDGATTSPDPEGDVARAFHVIERMRARALLDEMDSARVHLGVGEDTPEGQRRAEVLGEIATIQKRLTDPSIAADMRSQSLSRLEALELEEAALRASIARADPAFAALRSPELPSLDEVRRLLAADEAILSYQSGARRVNELARVERGGSWVLSITADRVVPIAIPDLQEAESAVALFLGLCRRRDGSDRRAAAALHDLVLAEALAELDPEVGKLVIVPDGALHRVPFAALGPADSDRPVGATYEVTQVPSVALWSRWRAEVERPAEPAVLALADPEIAGTVGDEETRSAIPWIDGLRLGSLPHARREARQLARTVGGESEVRSGPEASERFLKTADLDRFGVLHVAAHAVVDYDHPDRSAVVLTPGAEDEDGFLQVREIVELDLEGRVVVLSACRSASGTIFPGDGLTGLARGFFQAGARAVIGSLWPLRDEEARPFMKAFYERLAEGSSLADALVGARVARIEAGAPTSAWAGIVLLGDGEYVPFPGGAEGSSPVTARLAAGAIVLLVLLSVTLVARRVRTAYRSGPA